MSDELDALYGTPPEEFVTARDELAKRLRERGEREAAQEVKALRRPTVVVWAVNQLARRRPSQVAELIEAGQRLRQAQRAALRGESDELRAASRAERELVTRLAREAAKLLEAEGRAVPQATLDRIGGTLRSAAVGGEAQALLAAGRLTAEVEASGFDLLEPFAGETAVASPRREAQERKRRAAEAQSRVRELRGELEAAERAAADGEAAARKARAAADAAAARLAEAEAELRDLDR